MLARLGIAKAKFVCLVVTGGSLRQMPRLTYAQFHQGNGMLNRFLSEQTIKSIFQSQLIDHCLPGILKKNVASEFSVRLVLPAIILKENLLNLRDFDKLSYLSLLE